MQEMKESGIPWIGNIPKHLDIIRNKYLLSYIKGKKPGNINMNGEGIPYIGASDLDSSNGYSVYTTDIDIPEASEEDLLVLWDGARAGLAGTNKNGKLSSTVVKVIPTTAAVYKPFLYWYYIAFQSFMYDCVNGTTIPHMNRRYIEDIAFLTWSLEMQVLLSDYLDKKCAQIDSIIVKEQSVIDKLQEYKRSVITEVVTKGLNPDVEMKESGVEWVNSIPEMWEVLPFTREFSFFKGIDIKKTDLQESGTAVVSYGQVHAKDNTGYFLQDSLVRFISEEKLSSPKKGLLKSGDFVFADTSEDYAGIGNCIFINNEEPIYAGYHTLVARLRDAKYYNQYFAFLFLTDLWRSQLRRNATGTKVFSVTQKLFRFVSIIVPSYDEQVAIAHYLEHKCSAIDSVIVRKQSLITKLTEYKQSLIYEVVTGKKEVPHV